MFRKSFPGLLTCPLLGVLLLSVLPLSAQSPKPVPVYNWTTWSGRASIGQEDGAAAQARFNRPHGVAFDSAGNLYVADSGNHTIRKITPAGNVSTLAGTAGASGYVDGTGADARFNTPTGIAIDNTGNLYVTDILNRTIRKITPQGVVSTLAGQAGKQGAVDGPAGSARFDLPAEIAADASGNVYVADHGIRKISNGTVSTVFTSGQVTNASGESFTVAAGSSLATTPDGRLFFTSEIGGKPHRLVVLRLESSGVASVAADSIWDGDSTLPIDTHAMTADSNGRIYFSATIRVYYGDIQTLYRLDAGSLSTVTQIDTTHGTPDTLGGLAVNGAGDLFYTRESDDAIVRNTDVFAGTGWSYLGLDGTGDTARFSTIQRLACDPAGNIWAAEQWRNSVYHNGFWGVKLVKVSPTREARTVFSEYRSYPTLDVRGLGTDGTGNVYLGRYWGPFEIVQISPNETSAPLPGTSTDILAAQLSANASGTLLVLAQTHKAYIWRAGADWAELAGATEGVPMKDGLGAAARLGDAIALTVDGHGDFFFLDANFSITGAQRECYIRKITTSGLVTTVSPNLVIKAGLTGPNAEILPWSLAVDSHGTFFLSYEDHTIRQFVSGGELTIIGGTEWKAGSKDDKGTQALFFTPGALAVDSQDNLYVADAVGTTIRRGQYLGIAPLITAQPLSATASAGGSVQFNVTVSANPAPTYQWYFGSSAITGATGNTLSLSNLRSSDAGEYSVVVTNSVGSITSAKATLGVGSSSTPSSPSSGGSGGGAMEWWVFATLTASGLARAKTRSIARALRRI